MIEIDSESMSEQLISLKEPLYSDNEVSGKLIIDINVDYQVPKIDGKVEAYAKVGPEFQRYDSIEVHTVRNFDDKVLLEIKGEGVLGEINKEGFVVVPISAIGNIVRQIMTEYPSTNLLEYLVNRHIIDFIIYPDLFVEIFSYIVGEEDAEKLVNNIVEICKEDTERIVDGLENPEYNVMVIENMYPETEEQPKFEFYVLSNSGFSKIVDNILNYADDILDYAVYVEKKYRKGWFIDSAIFDLLSAILGSNSSKAYEKIRSISSDLEKGLSIRNVFEV